MARALLIAFAWTALVVGAASAAPGGNLSWLNCSTAASAANYSFACDDNTLTRNLVCSFTLANGLPDYGSVSGTIDWQLGHSSTPDYFQYGAGACREGAVGIISIGTVSGCTNPYAGSPTQNGGWVNEQLGPNRWRFRCDWGRQEGFNALPNVRYTGFILQFTTAGSFDDGFYPPFCEGCEVPVCYVLSRIEIRGLGGGSEIFTTADFRNWVTYQGGTGDCPGATPSAHSTWGAVKALYR